MILPELPGKTYGQVERLAARPRSPSTRRRRERRREDAEKQPPGCELFREESGAAALSGRDLPTDQTLAAHASVCARAQQYKDCGAFPADTGWTSSAPTAYLDLLNGVTAEARIASGQLAGRTRPRPTGDRQRAAKCRRTATAARHRMHPDSDPAATASPATARRPGGGDPGRPPAAAEPAAPATWPRRDRPTW